MPREVELINGYYNEDIRVAEQSLLGLLQLYSQPPYSEAEGLNGTLSLIHTRLYFLYSQLGRWDQALVHQTAALSLYPGNGEPDDEKWRSLTEAVQRLDRLRPVLWKRQETR